jgi:hypothetical protein
MHKFIGQSDVKHIMTSLIKTITSVQTQGKVLFAFWSLKPVLFLSCSSVLVIKHTVSQRYSVINHCDRHFYSSWWFGYIFGLFNISSKFLLQDNYLTEKYRIDIFYQHFWKKVFNVVKIYSWTTSFSLFTKQYNQRHSMINQW